MVTKIYIELDAVKIMVSKKGALVVVVVLIFMLPFIVADIFINEFTVDPQTDWDSSGGTTSSDEWFELYNSGVADVDLTGWNLSLNDTTPGIETLSGIIMAGNYFTILNPDGAQNNDGKIILYDNLGILIDKVSYGGWNDSNLLDNAPDGNANNANNECLSRINDGQDTNIDSDDFTKGTCTFNSTNNPLINTTVEFGEKSINSFCLIKEENITLYANISHSDPVEVTFSVFDDGEWKNFTGVFTPNGIGNYSSVIDTSLIEQGNHNWTVFAKDILNQTHQDGIESFYVNSFTDLEIFPDSPNGLNGWYVSEPTFVLSNPDAVKINYRWDGNFFNYTGPFGLSGTPNMGNVTGGVHGLRYGSNITCRLEPEHIETYYFDFTNPRVINEFPEDNSVVFNSKPLIGAYIDEVYQSNSGVDNSSTYIILDGVVPLDFDVVQADSIDAIISFTPSSNLSEGKHNVTVNTTDNSGRSSQFSWDFDVSYNDTDYDMAVHMPEDGIYDNRKINFNITTTKEVEEISYINWNDNKPRWQKLCSNCDEYGFSKKKTKRVREGENNLTFMAIDKFGDEREFNVLIFVDSKKPKISNTFPKRNSVVNGSFFSVKYIESDIKNVKLVFNPEINLSGCLSGRNQECSTSIDLSLYDNQTIEYHFEISDSISTTISKNVSVKVDTTSPVLTIFIPNETEYGRKVPFNITISEEAKLEYLDELDSKPTWRNLCRNCAEYGYLKEKEKSFKKGSHDLLIRAVDEAGNADIKNVSFSVV